MKLTLFNKPKKDELTEYGMYINGNVLNYFDLQIRLE